MSMSVINAVATTVSQPQAQQAAPAAATPPPASASLQNDTVTLSPAAQKASQGGDVDHDGDSH